MYLGLFHRDTGRKLLVAFSKSGCCYHETDKFRMARGRPVLTEKVIEEADNETMTIRTRRRVGGRWVKRVKR